MRIYKGDICLGELEGDTFITHRDTTMFFRKYSGFGMNSRLLDFLYAKEVKTIKIIYKGETNIEHFTCTITDFFKHGIKYQNPYPPNDEQLILNKKYFLWTVA